MLTAEQLHTYRTEGYVVIPAPWPAALSNDCLLAYERQIGMPANALASDAEMAKLSSVKTGVDVAKFRLRPAADDSTAFSSLDHSLPFLRVELHPSALQIARQLDKCHDIYFRNGGINEIAPGRAIRWHRDSSSKAGFEKDGVPGEDVEFMHYFHGSPCEGGFRLWPASHGGAWDEWQDEVDRQRNLQGEPTPEQLAAPCLQGVNDAKLSGEVTISLGPEDLLIRSSRLVHGTWRNDCGHGRLMHHWRFCPGDIHQHRIRFEEHMSPELLRSLSAEQREVLWVGRDFDIAPRYTKEYEGRKGKLLWGVDGSLPAAGGKL